MSTVLAIILFPPFIALAVFLLDKCLDHWEPTVLRIAAGLLLWVLTSAYLLLVAQ